jgi:hypothetical protein
MIVDRNFVIAILQSPESKCAHLPESDRTLRDGSFGGDSQALRARLRSHSLRDKSHSPMGSLIELALMGFQPWGTIPSSNSP